MEALGLKELDKPRSTDVGVTLGSLAEMTGFPIEYIKRELLLEEETMSVEELRERVLAYLNSL